MNPLKRKRFLLGKDALDSDLRITVSDDVKGSCKAILPGVIAEAINVCIPDFIGLIECDDLCKLCRIGESGSRKFECSKRA